MRYKTNRLLDALPDSARRAVISQLTHREFRQHDVLFDVHEPVAEVYFPIDTVISLAIPLATGEVVETAMMGRDGVLGASAALNGRVSLNRAIVQIAGHSLSCSMEQFTNIVSDHSHLRSLVGAHEQALFAQIQQSAACNVSHQLENRLARWLLRAADLHGGDELELTQEYLAEMLGVRRTSLTVVAHSLQEAGIIKCRRGRIKLTNIPALQETSCECYEAVKRNYDAMLQPSNEHVRVFAISA
jgi:CRP-like cAMP-binding protein